MNRQTVKIPKIHAGVPVNYLSDFISELPKNKIVNKGGTGVGGTTLAIRDKNPYVIAVPFQEMIINKCAKEDNLLGVLQGVSNKEIEEYLNRIRVPKIMVTYDSLPRLMEFINPQDFNLLIDEMHILFTAYSYRRDAAMNVLNNFRRFKSFTFLSATIMDDKYRLKELKDIDVIDYEWEDRVVINIDSIYCPDVIKSTIGIIENHTGDQNYYFFINSISGINDIVRTCGLNDDNARMICSKHNKAKSELIKSDTLSQPKRFNFITSASYEGCDLLDEDAVIFMISNGKQAHTLLDISTSVIQIAGRVRNTKYCNKVFHLYSTTRYNGVSKEQFAELCNKDIELGRKIESELSSLSDDVLERMESTGRYVIKNDNRFEFDENALLLDQFNFDVHNDYQLTQRVTDHMKESGIVVTEYYDTVKEIAIQSSDQISFKQRVIRLKELEENGVYDISSTVFKDITFKKYPWLNEAINKIGFSRISTLGYVQKAIKEEIIGLSDMSSEVKLIKMLDFELNVFYTNNQVKEKLQSLYEKSGLNKKAKASDIALYYDATKSFKRVDKKNTQGITVIRRKVFINN